MLDQHCWFSQDLAEPSSDSPRRLSLATGSTPAKRHGDDLFDQNAKAARVESSQERLQTGALILFCYIFSQPSCVMFSIHAIAQSWGTHEKRLQSE